MESIKFMLANVLAPVFEDALELAEEAPMIMGDQLEDAAPRTRPLQADSILDLSGPRLLEGARPWLAFYRVLGQINLASGPLYLSIIYKILLIAFCLTVIVADLSLPIFEENYLDPAYNRNPIYIIMCAMTALISAGLFALNFYHNTFKLGPLFKILATPRLCFINRAGQQVAGLQAFRSFLFFLLYHSVLVILQIHQDFAHFVANFHWAKFIMQMFAFNVFCFYLIGLSHLDFYIRFSFSVWLLALRRNLQNRRPQLAHLRQLLASRASSASGSTGGPEVAERELVREFKRRYVFVELKEVQKQLNSMDDHLEVWRNCQTPALICLTLSAFFTNGIVLMMAYNTLTKNLDTFHGIIWLLIAFDYALLIIVCYVGDSFIGYALACFVQTVEDEYFLQEDDSSAMRLLDGRAAARSKWAVRATPDYQEEEEEEEEEENEFEVGIMKEAESSLERQSLAESVLIRKEDVLFCRELLHQFHDHLATPWSRLSFKSHLNMLATFATLIAAQIIFEREIEEA